MIVLFYIACVALANIVTAATAPLVVGPFVITWGTWFVATTFVLRDLIQVQYGKRAAYLAIGAGLVVAFAYSLIHHDPVAIVVGSALAFGVSESLDTELFTRLRLSFFGRVVASGVASGAVDTTLFVLVALSPMWSGIIPWSQVPAAILGVYVVKAALQFVGAAVAVRVRPRLAADTP